MIRLNLPSFEIKLSGTKEQPRIFDILRHRYVAVAQNVEDAGLFFRAR